MELTVQRAESVKGTVKAPPSKSYSHRAFILASLSEGRSVVRDALYSEDTLASLEACRAFGAEFERKSEGECLIQGFGCSPSTPEDVLDVKNSGTTLRIMTSVSALAPGFTVFTGDDSLRQRPMQDLLDSLKHLGVNAHSTKNDGKAPLIVEGGFKGGKTSIPGDVSSQFVSSILIAGACSEEGVDLEVEGEFISRPYVDMTLDIMEKFGVKVDYHENGNSFHVNPQKYRSRDYTVEGDYSSASYLVAAASILKSELKVQNLFSDSKQGDKIILDIVSKMGCDLKVKRDEVKIDGHGKLQGVDVDLHNAPDLLPTVAALGALAQGTTMIHGVEHARYKETDRIHTCGLELSKLGVSLEERRDGLVIHGGSSEIHGGVVNSHNDHRLVMALYLIGLKVGDVKITNASVYDVSFPGFPETMKKICRSRT